MQHFFMCIRIKGEKFYSFRRKNASHGAVHLNLKLTRLLIQSNWTIMRFSYSVQPTIPYMLWFNSLWKHTNA